MSRFVGAFVLSICLLTPVGIGYAQDHDRDHMAQNKHEWNDREDKNWHDYLKAHHRKNHDWSHATKREQQDYWKWRDQHPDR